MEAVLHIEPITRYAPAPISVGHSDYIFIGENRNEDGEDTGASASNIRLGCPLYTVDTGSTRTHIPLVKTIEYMPDHSRDSGHVYLETLHYLKDRKFLIPFRTKLRSGLGSNLRLTHIPSLNDARSDFAGLTTPVCDPRADILTDIAQANRTNLKSKNPPLYDWITEELTNNLAHITVNELSFDPANFKTMVDRYETQLHHTPNYYTQDNLKSILSIILPDVRMTPSEYGSVKGISRHISEFKQALVPNGFDFRSFGNIPIEKLDRIDYNPAQFQEICDILDYIPLTDFNVDFVIGVSSDIEFYHEHVSLNRFGIFADNDSGVYNPETLLREYLTEEVLNTLLQKFARYHSNTTEELENLIRHHPIKIKVIKTITDEAAILLYDYNSKAKDPPLCGVYFDIALQSLAPMSIVPENQFYWNG